MQRIAKVSRNAADQIHERRKDLNPISGTDRAALILGTGFGVGYSPILPGTVGSLWGILLAWGIHRAATPLPLNIAICIALFPIGIPICARAARVIGKDDPGSVVFDEIAAIPFLYLAVPVTTTSLVAGFFWFRLFDIIKPWPVRYFDRWHGGLGIMADDTAAAVYASAALWLTMQGLDKLA
jgi:phosphatidylglycerophosphatase A